MMTQMTLVITAQELLSAIWYPDGSGAHIGVDTPGTPEGWKLGTIDLLETGDVRLFLTRDHEK